MIKFLKEILLSFTLRELASEKSLLNLAPAPNYPGKWVHSTFFLYKNPLKTKHANDDDDGDDAAPTAAAAVGENVNEYLHAKLEAFVLLKSPRDRMVSLPTMVVQEQTSFL